MATLTDPALRDDELQALIEEARRRARRRRMGYLAAALAAGLLAAGALLLVGGGGGSAEPGGSGTPEPGSSAGLTLGSDAQAANACPQLYAEPRDQRVIGKSVTLVGCEFRFHAALPTGWHANGAPVTAWPPPGPISTLILNVPSFSNSTTFGGEMRPFSMAPGHVTINVEDRGLATARNLARFGPIALGDSDFRQIPNRHSTDTAHTRLIFGGWAFQATVFAHHGDESLAILGEVNSLLNSMTATQRSCPCR